MPTNDIIDNRDERLIDHIRQILPGSRSAKFAVGYFFLSGLETVADQLGNVEELRLLIGNTWSRQAWSLADVTPYQIYLKTMCELARDELAGKEAKAFLWWDDITAVLTEFQLRVVRYAVFDPGPRSRSQTRAST